MKKRTLKVGFDLDGVILYNPLRTARPILAYLRQFVIKSEKKSFYIPKTLPEKLFWFILHKSSIWPAPGLTQLKDLLKKRQIEAYVITGRYDSLTPDFERWMERLDAKNHFVHFVCNKKNEQPHEFKKRMIQKFKLDLFVEDNWDIVHLLDSGTGARILWLTNALDRRISYPYKFTNLKQVVDYLRSYVG
ncbi:hypothetical protein HYT33_04600 [Candidatus Roizmanbacteria bacterium]|nr:hypothetical protein [Candidatus Roizmanbacteria bacterium]